MTSPITHEKIIEVLRKALAGARADIAKAPEDTWGTDTMGDADVPGGLMSWPVKDEILHRIDAALETASDLYQRLQAEKGVGGGGRDPYSGLTHSPAAQYVAPPASATAGTGRAPLGNGGDLLDALLDAHHAYEEAATDSAARAARKQYLAAKQALLDHIVAMYAEGERIGIEKAAKVAEETDYYGKIPLGWTLAVSTAADNIRALISGGKPEVDPNAWAFKHGLEST